MIFGSVFSGIEAASVAWHSLGWRPAFFSEIANFPSAVLAHHYPAVVNYGDIREQRNWPHADVDVLCGGPPCQSDSVAGKRGGMADPRGALKLTYLDLAERLRSRWVLFEGVPGVRSVDKGRAFGSLVGGLEELGYGVCWTSLDAQYFGLAQRRRRVFALGYLGAWQPAAAVLFDAASLRGDPAPRRETRQGAAGTPSQSSARRSADKRERGALIASHDPACTLTARDYKGPLPEADLSTVITHALTASGFDASEDGTGRGTPLVPVGFNARQDPDVSGPVSGPLDTDGGTQAIAFSGKDYGADVGEIAPKLRAMGFDKSHANAGGQVSVCGQFGVRRLTPRECERLQGFPDDYTLIPYRGKPAADGPRYAALGNSWAVPVVRWIGERIAAVNGLLALQQALTKSA